MFPIAQPITVPGNRSRERARHVRALETSRKLTDALYEWLTLDAQICIEEIDNPPEAPAFEPIKPKPTIEYLMHVQKQRENFQSQIDQILAALDNEDIPDTQAAIVEASLVTPLRSQVAYLDEQISEIQRALENQPITNETPGEPRR